MTTRLVVVSFLCLAGLARVAVAEDAPRTLPAARKAATEAAAAEDWPAAEAAYREAARLAGEQLQADPQNLDIAIVRDTFLYNAACSAALQGHVEPAFELLEGLVGAGWYDNAGLLANDSDLRLLRANTGRFAALTAAADAVLAAAAAGHVEGRILRPAGLEAKSTRVPGLVVLHGGGGNVEGIEGHWQAVADRSGAVVILVRGVMVQGVGEFSYNQRDPARDAARIEKWIAQAKADVPGLHEGQLFLSGFSQGGGMAWVLALRGERAWRGVIPIGGYVQGAVRERVMGEPQNPVQAFAIVGENDEPAILDMNRKLTTQPDLPRLRAHLETLPAAGHALPADLPGSFSRAMHWCRRQPPR